MSAAASAAAAALAALLLVLNVGLVRAGLFQHGGVLAHDDRLEIGLELGSLLFAALLRIAGDRREIVRNGWVGLARLAVAQNTDIAVVVADDGVGLLLQPDADALLEQIDLRDRAAAVRRVDERFILRAGLQQLLIGLLLVVQAAHQSAAGAGNFRGIQAEVLRLGHLDGHRLEIVQELAAAERAAADAEAADHLRLVAHADLPQLDAGAQHGGEALDQLAEVDAAVGREEEQDLAAVKGIFRRDELHFQPEVGDLLLADVHGALFAAAVLGVDALVLLRGQPQDGAQRRSDLARVHHVVAADALAEFGPAGSLQNDLVARCDLQLAGREEIDL